MTVAFFQLCCTGMLLLISSVPVTSAETFSVIAYQNANPPYNIRATGNSDHHRGVFVNIFARLEVLTGDRFEFYHYLVFRAAFGRLS
jgi:hypothetical protein